MACCNGILGRTIAYLFASSTKTLHNRSLHSQGKWCLWATLISDNRSAWFVRHVVYVASSGAPIVSFVDLLVAYNKFA